MTTGILEGIQAQLARIEAKLESAIRATEAAPQDDSIWSGGAMSLTEAQAFAHMGRDELYRLMNAGEMPWAVLTRARVVPRKWLVAYLERKQHEAKAIR